MKGNFLERGVWNMKAVYEMPRVHFEAFASNIAVANGSCSSSDNNGGQSKASSSQQGNDLSTVVQNMFENSQQYVTVVWDSQPSQNPPTILSDSNQNKGS